MLIVSQGSAPALGFRSQHWKAKGKERHIAITLKTPFLGPDRSMSAAAGDDFPDGARPFRSIRRSGDANLHLVSRPQAH